jgi:hypothetical protein
MAITLLNLGLSVATWLPALAVYWIVTIKLLAKVESRFPGYDNAHKRIAASMFIGAATMIMLISAWWGALLLTKGLRCAF